MQKVCSDCGQEKPVDDFYKHSRRKDGFEADCKECKKRKQRERYAQPGGKEKRQKRYQSNRTEIISKQKERKRLKANNTESQIRFREKQKIVNSKHIPIPFRFSENDLKRIDNERHQSKVDSFSAAFKAIIEGALKNGSYYNLNAFDNAVSCLDKNFFQLHHLKNNLDQLYDGYLNGKVPGLENQVKDLKELIQLCSSLLNLVLSNRNSILMNQPE